MCKTKPTGGKGYTVGAACITSILMNNVESKENLDTGAFCTCVGAIKGHEVDITLNIDRPSPQVLGRQAYQASTRAREALEEHIQELIQLDGLREVGHNEQVEVTNPVIIARHNDKSRMVGDFTALNN
ncbi:hypothetical protein O181_068084 [Austropuccinia psidii MF-1]|uniref:Uncharacterized protein n=1 Tax=Austropuccinia psidii MF-1 TaxID=1389203 RepID=A0A9Q3I777_9BASI|nr:hypothetical protein [Austropuccinia psidii MF-1]